MKIIENNMFNVYHYLFSPILSVYQPIILLVYHLSIHVCMYTGVYLCVCTFSCCIGSDSKDSTGWRESNDKTVFFSAETVKLPRIILLLSCCIVQI